jgi:hypothetical protein
MVSIERSSFKLWPQKINKNLSVPQPMEGKKFCSDSWYLPLDVTWYFPCWCLYRVATIHSFAIYRYWERWKMYFCSFMQTLGLLTTVHMSAMLTCCLLSPSTILSTLYGSLSPVRPWVPSMALCPLYGHLPPQLLVFPWIPSPTSRSLHAGAQ